MRKWMAAAALFLSLFGSLAYAQTAAPDDKGDKTDRTDKTKNPYDSGRYDTRPVETFYLSNASEVNGANEILTALRVLLDAQVKLYLTPDQNAISVRATPEEMALVKQLIGELDKPQKIFHLTYTLDESDSGKRVGIQRFTLIVAAGHNSTLKEGSKVPIVTGSYDQAKGGNQSPVTYIDVGLNIQATVDDYGAGLRLSSKVEQSSVAEDKSTGVSMSSGDPVVRQAVLEGTALLTPGKPAVLGSIDVPGSTRHLDISVVAEQVK